MHSFISKCWTYSAVGECVGVFVFGSACDWTLTKTIKNTLFCSAPSGPSSFSPFSVCFSGVDSLKFFFFFLLKLGKHLHFLLSGKGFVVFAVDQQHSNTRFTFYDWLSILLSIYCMFRGPSLHESGMKVCLSCAVSTCFKALEFIHKQVSWVQNKVTQTGTSRRFHLRGGQRYTSNKREYDSVQLRGHSHISVT